MSLKSAEEWNKELKCNTLASFLDNLRAVQRDARIQGLRDAVEICRREKTTGDSILNDGIDDCITVIQSAITKLEKEGE